MSTPSPDVVGEKLSRDPLFLHYATLVFKYSATRMRHMNTEAPEPVGDLNPLDIVDSIKHAYSFAYENGRLI